MLRNDVSLDTGKMVLSVAMTDKKQANYANGKDKCEEEDE